MVAVVFGGLLSAYGQVVCAGLHFLAPSSQLHCRFMHPLAAGLSLAVVLLALLILASLSWLLGGVCVSAVVHLGC